MKFNLDHHAGDVNSVLRDITWENVSPQDEQFIKTLGNPVQWTSFSASDDVIESKSLGTDFRFGGSFSHAVFNYIAAIHDQGYLKIPRPDAGTEYRDALIYLISTKALCSDERSPISIGLHPQIIRMTGDASIYFHSPDTLFWGSAFEYSVGRLLRKVQLMRDDLDQNDWSAAVTLATETVDKIAGFDQWPWHAPEHAPIYALRRLIHNARIWLESPTVSVESDIIRRSNAACAENTKPFVLHLLKRQGDYELTEFSQSVLKKAAMDDFASVVLLEIDKYIEKIEKVTPPDSEATAPPDESNEPAISPDIPSNATCIGNAGDKLKENIAIRLNLHAGNLRCLIEALDNDRMAGKPVNATIKRKELGISRPLAKVRGDVRALKITKDERKELLDLLK
jgi:hypothetical protein